MEVKPQTRKRLKLYMHAYDHRVWKKRATYIFQIWKGVDEYRDPVKPTSLSDNFVAVFPEVTSLLNDCVEWTVILSEITQDNNKVLGDESNETVKFRRLERSMKESVSTFHIVVEVEQ